MQLPAIFHSKIILLLASVFALIYLYTALTATNMLDLTVYHSSSLAFLQGKDPYQAATPTPLNYPPSAFPILSLSVLLPSQLLIPLWTSISTIFLFVSLYITLNQNLKQSLAFTAICFAFFPFRFNLALGQVNTFILAFLMLSYYFFTKEKNLLSGIFLGLAAALKITPLFLIVFFLKKKRWSTAIVAFITFIGLNLLVSYIHPLPLLQLFLHQATTNFSTPIIYQNQSIMAVFMRHITTHKIFVYLAQTFIVLTAIVTTHKNSLHYYAYLLLTLLFVSPITWEHHFILIIPTIIIILHNIHQKLYTPLITDIALIAIFALSLNLNLFIIQNPVPILVDYGFISIFSLWCILTYTNLKNSPIDISPLKQIFVLQ